MEERRTLDVMELADQGISRLCGCQSDPGLALLHRPSLLIGAQYLQLPPPLAKPLTKPLKTFLPLKCH